MPARSVVRSPSPASKPSIIDRLKKPFGPKARLFSEFYIQPDDPHRVYGPGDVITGSVVLKVTKPFSVTHIVVSLHGYAQVYRTPNSPGEGYKQYHNLLTSGKTKKAGGYYGNGFVALFEDEIILCGDGRLGEGTYQFNFELIFPKQHLPSSIDFERGIVGYMITATMTRPTTLSPTSICDRPINFQEDIDVAPLSQPKPRIITLEPRIPRTKPRNRPKRQPPSGDADQSTSGSTVGSEDTATEAGAAEGGAEAGSQAGLEPPQSPIQSEVSFESYISSGGTGSAIDSAAPSAKTCESRLTNGKSSHSCSRCRKQPITSTIAIERAGFLRGDSIPVRVWLKHTRAVKSLRGVIVTLYRQARVDMHPALPLVRGGDDDVYPRSRTGLSGLSLSSAGSTHTYRKDLDQQFASLIVNPATLQAEVKLSLRVPDEAFPSIASVPGAMISFKYYVEVMVDIQGKLAQLDKYLPTVSTPQATPTPGRMNDTNGNIYAPWGGHFINTEEIKREKSVVYSVFEVVVGTRDSERRSPWKQPQTEFSKTIATEDLQATGPSLEQPTPYAETNGLSANGDRDPHQSLSWAQYWQDHPPDHHEDPPPIEAFPPPPQIEEEHNLSEKEQIRRAEQRLLPSAPPETGETSAGASAYLPSAPPIDLNRSLPPTPYSPPNLTFTAGASSPPPVDGPSAPAYEHTDSAPAQRTDDKEDLRRQRLEAERSAPPPAPLPQNSASNGAQHHLPDVPTAPPASQFEPSAPTADMLGEGDRDDFGFAESSSVQHQHHQHALPRYER